MANPTAPLRPNQIAEMLRAASTLLQVELNALPSEALRWHPKPEEWCIQQVLGHLIETEKPGFADRIRTMIENQDPQLVSLDQVEEAVARRDCERDGAELLKEFISLRDASCTLVSGLKDADLRRGGWHPDAGYIRIEDLLHEWVYHDRDHIRQIMANIQALVWAHLGNTQSFYQS
jgi:hypothetical protein